MYDKRYTAIKGSIGVGRKGERERVSIVYDFGLKFSQEVNQQNFGHLKLATQ